jgi:hypothetical protein
VTVEAGVPGVAHVDHGPAVGRRFETGETQDALREMSLTEPNGKAVEDAP